MLFRHSRRVRPEKGQSIHSVAEYDIIGLSRLHLVNALPRFVEPLQGKGDVGEIGVITWIIRCESHGLPGDFRSLFILPLAAVYDA